MPVYPTCSHTEGLFRCKTLTMKDILSFHSLFYKKPERDYQSNFILKFVEVKNVKRRRNRKNKTKEKQQLLRTTRYFVRSSKGEKVPVCMDSFLDIICFSRFKVNKITADHHKTGIVVDKRGGFRQNEKYKKQRESVRAFINKLQCVESHYCRSTTLRKYLQVA